MDEFSSLEALYQYLDRESTQILDYHDIPSLFVNLRNKFEKDGLFLEAEKAQWEIDIFSFILSEGTLKPLATIIDNNGDLIEIPNFERFSQASYEYFIERLTSTPNPLIKARYAHTLWQSPKKHGKFADISIREYLNLVRIYEEKDSLFPNKNFGIPVLNFLKSAYFLAVTVNSHFNEIKETILRIVKNYDNQSNSVFALKYELIGVILKDRKIFGKDDLIGLDDLCSECCEALIAKDRRDFAIKYFELGEQIGNKLGKRSLKWQIRIAKSYETMMEQHIENQSYFAASIVCLDAISHYRKARKTKKVEELTKIYSKIKDKVPYEEFKAEIDISDHIKECKEFGEKVATHKSDEIIDFLIFDDTYLLPSLERVQARAKELDTKYPLSSILPTTVIDQSNHPSQHFRDEDTHYHSVLEQYRIELEANNRFRIREIFLRALTANKLDTNVIVNYLKKNSWLGKNIPRHDPTGKITHYNWISLLAPSIDEYFRNVALYLLNLKNPMSFVLCLDSLTLKIEGIIRDFCRLNNVPTSSMKADGIVREKLLNELIDEDVIQERFSKEEIMFFKFILIEKAGYNVRHKVAHALMTPPEYSIDLIHYLLIIVMRLGKYNISKKM
jgi:hypothetical protein